MTKPIIVGLTGQSGAGKSTVSMEFMLEDFHVINCDRMTHILLQPGTECSKALQAQFPDFYSDGIFDRRKAAPMLFADKELLKRYNAAIFPFINDEIEKQIKQAGDMGEKYILLDAPTLFEAGADKLCDVIVSCIADMELRLGRITERDMISREDAMKRFRSQHDEEFFRERSDYIIENNGSIEEASEAAEKIAKEIKERQNDKN